MHYKTLGNTGLLVSRICLGGMTFSSDAEGIWKHIAGTDQQQVDHVIKTSIDAGVNFIDTADVYSNGQSETMLGQSLKNLNIARKDIVIASKAFGRTGPGRNDVGASRGHIMNAVEASLKRLDTDCPFAFKNYPCNQRIQSNLYPIWPLVRSFDKMFTRTIALTIRY